MHTASASASASISKHTFFIMTKDEYNKCVQHFSDGLFRFVLSNIRNREMAEDIVQESFLKIWERRDAIPMEKAKPYLFTTAYHALIDQTRKKENTAFVSEEAASFINAQGGNPRYPDVQEVLHQAIATLPEVQASAILLRDYEGYSYEEIGRILNLSESQVKVYIFRGRTALKNYLKSMDNLIDIES